jgi:hypothetical protein
MVEILNVPAQGRVMRRPKHTYHLRFQPWIIQPFCIAPVLPGETMRQALMQARAVTEVIKNPLIGWWLEQYLFYVKHRDLDGRDDFQKMVLQSGYSLAAYNRAADVQTFHNGPGIDWTYECLKRVVAEYFRDEGEAWNVAGSTIGGMPLAKIEGETGLESLVNQADLDEGGSPQDGTETLHELEQYIATYEFMRQQKLTNMTYEDWLRTYGVRGSAAQDPHKPELIRFVRDWTYPTNTVDPATGAPSSACSWVISERADKDRFFAEPGFLFGLMVARPKVYLSKQTGALISAMGDALSWLPAVMREEPYTSLKNFAYNAGPVRNAAVSGGYWIDIRDLLLYGDQFLNFTLSATDAGLVALPDATWKKKYVAQADIDGLFPGTNKLVKCDGVVQFLIAGSQKDQT